jgi:dethiobiotin synthetase
LRGVFVTGTDTEVGKSVVAASICAALTARGHRVAAFKPVVTGLDEEPGEFGRDHELLAAAASAGQAPEDVAPYLFAPPVSPHFAAQQERARIEPSALLHAARAHELVVCEGVGGLMVPITPGYLVRDLAIDLGLPMLVAARPGLGTINHTLLTIEAARAGGIEVVAVVITPWPDDPSPMEHSNRDTIERLGGVPVHALPRTTPDRLARAGASLPVEEWL